jgi:26S proteasome regulatory subunit N2
MNLLQPYLPEAITDDGESGNIVSPTGGYAEGGSLFALGLIHGSHAGSSAEKRKETCDFIRKHLKASHTNEVISHGAALGVGLTSMGSADLTTVNELKELLYNDSAVAGEAAGIAIGMVLVGSGAGNTHNSLAPEGKEELMEIVNEVKNYARETQHEKIIRGIAMGLALINYGQEENADAVIEEMRSDRDPILRYGAQYALALAYIGTGSNKAIRILLHTAVSDVSDDVRMAAVLGLAFVLYKTPERVPQLVKLLLESFNPHVRYASCMAVGIAMAGTGDTESVLLLEPMLDDMTDYVRQGALMGTAMIYMQQSDTCNGKKIRAFRERLTNIVKDKHQSTLTKMGAILSKGIIDAGGRNVSVILGSRNGFTKMTSAVGVALWLQHWHWYPMMHMFSLAVAPTYTIGLNKDLKYPKGFEIQCNSKPSVFAYPKKLEEKKEEKKKRVETVTLSTTAKSKARLARKKAKEGADESKMDLDESELKIKKDEDYGKKGMEVDDEAKRKMDLDESDIKEEDEEKKNMEVEDEEPKAKKKREPEPTSFRVKNPSRITKAQSKVCEFDFNQRYRPIRSKEKPYGVIILTDSTPDKADNELAAVKAPSLEPEGECAPPEPFEWTPPEVSDTEESKE